MNTAGYGMNAFNPYSAFCDKYGQPAVSYVHYMTNKGQASGYFVKGLGGTYIPVPPPNVEKIREEYNHGEEDEYENNGGCSSCRRR